MQATDMFPEAIPLKSLSPPKPPRKKRQLKAHVWDAGENVIFFKCRKCKWESGWIEFDMTVTEAKKGIPCEKCNKKE